MTIIDFIGFIDPPRPGIKCSISKLKKAGIRVIMVTGNYNITTTSISQEIGMIKDCKKSDNLTKLRELKTYLVFDPEYDKKEKA